MKPKPCPWCGGPAEFSSPAWVKSLGGKRTYQIGCAKVGDGCVMNYTAIYTSKSECIAVWNKRAGETNDRR